MGAGKTEKQNAYEAAKGVEGVGEGREGKRSHDCGRLNDAFKLRSLRPVGKQRAEKVHTLGRAGRCVTDFT